jgi:hypothetical protein
MHYKSAAGASNAVNKYRAVMTLGAIGLLVACGLVLAGCGQQGRLNLSNVIIVTEEPTVAKSAAPISTQASGSGPASVQLYTNSNALAAWPGADEQAMFTIKSGSVHMTRLTTYHYVEPKGVSSVGSIGLIGPDNEVYGPWQATGVDGQGGIKNASWVVNVDVILPAGLYWVTDSDWTTWSSNMDTAGAGMFWVYGYPVS